MAVKSYNRVVVGAIPIIALIVPRLHGGDRKRQPLVADENARLYYSVNHL